MEFANFVQETQDRISFDVKGITNAEANALRRSLIRHVPVMQIADEHFHIECKSLPSQPVRKAFIAGLRQVPFLVDPGFFQSINEGENTVLDECNCLKYRLFLEYPYPRDIEGKKIKYDSVNCPEKRILSSAIEWIPLNDQQKANIVKHHQQYEPKWTVEQLCGPTYKDIILGVLRPGECVDVSFYLTAGTKAERNHSSFSAINIATSAAIPHVTLLKPITDIEEAVALINICPQRVFAETKQVDNSNTSLVTVMRPQNCSHCQQCTNNQNSFGKNIRIHELPNQFHFVIESHGSIPVKKLFEKACDAMIEKSTTMLQTITLQQ